MRWLHLEDISICGTNPDLGNNHHRAAVKRLRASHNCASVSIGFGVIIKVTTVSEPH